MREPVHSGVTLRDDLDALAMSPAADARRRHGTVSGALREPLTAGRQYVWRTAARQFRPRRPHANRGAQSLASNSRR